MGTRVFIGRLSNSARERDVERFFKGYGKIMEVVLKTGFGFVEFEDPRDADDAVYDLNGKNLCGERVTIEHARSPNERFQARNSRGLRRPAYQDRPESPIRTDYRIVVENLSSRVGRQELREFLNKVGEVTYADVTRDRNEGVAEFATLGDMKNVLTKLNGEELRGRKLRLIEDRGRRHSKSPSRKRSAHSRSRSRSRSPRRSRSGRRDRSARRSPSPRRSRTPRRSPSRSPSPRAHANKSPRVSRSASKEEKKSPSRSPSRRSASRSRSRSRARSSSGGGDDRNDRKSRSRSE